MLAIKKKYVDMKIASLYNKRNATNANAQKLKKAQSELTIACLKEQTGYIQNQINNIRYSVEDIQSWITGQIVNEVSKRNSTAREKLKVARQEEWIQFYLI